MSLIKEEMFGVSLGDSRLNKRAIQLLEDMGKQPEASLPSTFQSWNETLAAYRFFSNDSVDSEKVLSPHKEKTIERIKEHKVVLCAQDTSELDFSQKKETNGLGYLRHKLQHGMYLHPILAVTPDRIPLGILDAKLWARDNEEYGKSKNYGNLKIEEKESFRWLEGYRKICKYQENLSNTELIYVADREGDIYDFFLEDKKITSPNKPSWIVRGCYNRNLEDGNKLFDSLEKSPVLGKIEFDISKTRNRKSRHVTQTLQVINVILKAPRRKGYKLPNTTVTAILAQEKKCPKNEKPLRWILLTNKKISSAKDAAQIVDYYLCRWEIEVFFRTLKSGCKIEELQLEDISRIKPAVALYLIVAWRVLYLSKISRCIPKESCSLVLEKKEWRVLYMMCKKKNPPNKAPSMGKVIIMLASLGGYLNRKNDLPPGPKFIWIGLQKLRNFIFAINTLEEVKNVTYV